MDLEQPDGRSRLAPGRMPRRVTDRVEDAVAWLLTSLALLTGVLAVVAGVSEARQGAERVRVEAGDRVPVRVVLLAPADVTPAPDGVSLPTPVDVPARWILADGTERVAPVTTAVRDKAGAELTKWVDRSGRPVPAPMAATTAWLEAVLWGVLVGLSCWLMLAVTWWGVRRWTGACNAARWARQWWRVEPQWSGRLPWE